MRLEEAVLEECRKLISRHHREHGHSRALTKRFVRATGELSTTPTSEPPHWHVSSCFNPFKVRERAPQIAKALQGKIAEGMYSPLPALVKNIKKPDGGTRPIAIFPVADAAVASICFKSILRRNASRLSPFSYAYREDITLHDAIERLWRETGLRDHYYLVEFDFSKYFDTIHHGTLIQTLNRHFKLTKTEQSVVSSILKARRAFGPIAYQQGDFKETRRGIPQGNTLSLFLANVACHELDLSLTRSGALFARYADDIVVVCRSRSDAEKMRERILSHCTTSGLAVNFKKSPGITEIGPHGLRSESPIRTYFDFLGHRFCYRLTRKRDSPAEHVTRRLSMRPTTESRVKAKLGKIIYSHLLRYPEAGYFTPARIGAQAKVDWDVVTCINDLRNYIYGGIPEDEIRGAIGDRSRRAHVPRGIMAFFPHISDIEQLRKLDGWLLNALTGAIRVREIILQQKFGVQAYPTLSSNRLIAADWYDDGGAHEALGEVAAAELAALGVLVGCFA